MLVLGLVDIPIWAQVLILLVGMVIAYVVYMTWDYNIFKKMGVDGPKPSLVVGNMGLFMSEGVVKAEQELYKNMGKYLGKTFESKFPTLFIADPKLLREILVKDFNSFVNRRDFDQMDDPLRDSLITLKDDHWRFVRNMITPTFSGKKLKEMGPLIRQAGDLLIELLEEKAAKNEDTSLKTTFGAYTMDCIARTSFGLEINTQRDPDGPFIKHAKAFSESKIIVLQLMIYLFLPFMTWLPRVLQSMGINMTKNATNFFVSVTEKALKERRHNPGNHADFLELMAHAKTANEESTQPGATTNPQISRKILTDAEIRSQALLFFLAGYDTTSNSLTFAFYHLAIHTDVCDRVIQELDDNLGKENPDYENIKKLTYMDMVIEETMRIFPAASRIDRIASRDVTIGNVKIPKDMIVNIPVGAIQMDPEYWPDPEKFDPERFTPEAKANRDPYTYLPFGAGPRNCIGIRLALMQQKMCMAQVLQHFRPVRSERTDCPPKLSKLGNVVTDEGLWIKFEKRS